MTADEMREMLRRMCEEAGSQEAWAKAHGFGQSYVSQVILGLSTPSPRLLAEMGMREVVSYEPVGETP